MVHKTRKRGAGVNNAKPRRVFVVNRTRRAPLSPLKVIRLHPPSRKIPTNMSSNEVRRRQYDMQTYKQNRKTMLNDSNARNNTLNEEIWPVNTSEWSTPPIGNAVNHNANVHTLFKKPHGFNRHEHYQKMWGNYFKEA